MTVKTLAGAIEKCKQKIANLEFDIAVEKTLLQRLGELNEQCKPPTPPTTYLKVDRIIAVLKNAEVPISCQQIAAVLKQRGIKVSCKTKLHRIVSSTICRRKDLFKQVSRRRYRLRNSDDKN